MTLQVIKAEDVRDGEPRIWIAHRQDMPHATTRTMHTSSRRDAGCQSCEFAIVDRPAPSTAIPANRFDCAKCGQAVKADEDGCCATCGRNCTIVFDDTQPPPVLDLDAAEKRAAGFRGVFRVMSYESGDEFLEYIADGSDDDDPTEIAQFSVDEPAQRAIADTLNAAPHLIAEAPLDNLRRLVAGWRGQWRVDAHEGITLSHDGDEWPIGALDGDAVIMLVELLNAIRPAVDGATAEIERLTAELVAERRSDREAVAFANDAAIGDFIDGHAKRLCEQAGEHWTGDGEQLDAWAAKVHDVLNHLRADADGTVIDGRESKPATVGGLLATEADALLCRWYAAKQDAIGALVDLENLRRPDPDDSWAGGIGRHDPMPGAEKRAADTKERLVAITDKVIAAMTRGPIGEG